MTMLIKKYRRRSELMEKFEDTLTEAVLVTPSNFKDVASWVNSSVNKRTAVSMSCLMIDRNWIDQFLHGGLTHFYICRDAKGHFCSTSKDAFEHYFKEVDS